MGLVFSIFKFFINKIYHAKKLSEKKIPTCGNSASVDGEIQIQRNPTIPVYTDTTLLTFEKVLNHKKRII